MSKEGSSIDAEVIKGIHTQITFPTQRDELQKVVDSSLPTGVGFGTLPTKIQTSYVTYVQ